MKELSLSGKWKCKPDREDIGIENKWFELYFHEKQDLLEIEIPNSFNMLKGYEIFEGIFWHFHQFNLNSSDLKDGLDYLIRFKGSNYNTKVWLNNEFLGENAGGFIPFYLKIKKELFTLENNFLVVRTDNSRRKGQIPDISFDWFNWGGIYRSVDLLLLSKNRITDVVIKTSLESRIKSLINVSYKIVGQVPLKWQILDADRKKILFEGEESKHSKRPIGGFVLTIDNPKLWSPDNPNLYHLKIISTSPDSQNEILYDQHFGIRQIETSGPYLYLNKKKIYLKGICLHEEYMPYGRTIPYEKREEDIKNMKSIGLNALRTAHYSHDEDLMDVADKLGMLILEEIPVYWFCDYKNNETFKLAAKMARDLVKRDINHPSVILWSVGNEVPIQQPNCSRFFKRMMDWVRKLDDTRIVTYVSHRMVCDLTRRKADVACINAYFGWYYGSPKMISMVLDMMRTPVHDKPVFYTEFGAGAKYGFRPGWKAQVKYSEEKQLQVLDYTIRTLNSMNYVAGWFIWAYRDFRSLLRENEYQQGFNRKGIVSGEKNEKKLIYYRIPKIVNAKRDLKNTKILGIMTWIILFPIAYFLTYVIDFLMSLGQGKGLEIGRKKEMKRLNGIN